MINLRDWQWQKTAIICRKLQSGIDLTATDLRGFQNPGGLLLFVLQVNGGLVPHFLGLAGGKIPTVMAIDDDAASQGRSEKSREYEKHEGT